MTAFTRTWDATYEASPPGTQAANQLDTRIQEVKVDVRERLVVEHAWAGDGQDGIHKFPRLNLAARNAITGMHAGQMVIRSDARSIDIYDGSAWIEYMGYSPGDIKFAGYDTASPPGWLKCDGAAVSRTTYAALFAAIGVSYGNGDGATTFNVPNMPGRTPVAYSAGDADFGTMGQAGGAKTHTLSVPETPAHAHPGSTVTIASDGAHVHTLSMEYSEGNEGARIKTGTDIGSVDETTSEGMNSAGAHAHAGSTVTVASQGGGGAHNNLQPYLVFQAYIKT